MKKTVLLLVFALCAATVLAQSASPYHKALRAPSRTLPMVKDYGTSLFTKDAAPIASIDFSAFNQGYTTGVVTSGYEAHTENYDFAFWHRWPNLDGATLMDTYPRLFQDYFIGLYGYSVFRSYLDTSYCSSNNGFMMISSYNQQYANAGNFNAFIRFDNIDATEVQVLEVSFFQFFRKYYDHCYIDYSIDGGNNWSEMEINTDGIDVYSSNPYLWGVYRFTLPAAAAGNVLSVRIRYKSLDSDFPYCGYFWIIDDVNFYAAPRNQIRTFAQEYVEGNYAMIPQDMTINPAWYSNVLNSGYGDQTNVQANLYHLDSTGMATLIDSYYNGNLPVLDRMAVIADRGGWLNTESLDYRGWYGFIDHTAHGVGMPLPTSTVGDNYVFAQVASDSVSVTYDTIYYQVTTADASNEYRWAHDNGVLTYSHNNYYIFGYTNKHGSWYISDDEEDVYYYWPGYSITSRYTTDQVVPEDWVIHGVEMVATPVFNSRSAKISATLLRDEYNGESVDFRPIVTGANSKTLTADDVNNDSVIGPYGSGFLLPGQYNTIYIPFPEQPALTPNTSYRVGYVLEEPSYFALAQEAQGSYCVPSSYTPVPPGPGPGPGGGEIRSFHDNDYSTIKDRFSNLQDSIIYFNSNDSTAKWAHHFVPNQYDVLVYDPSYEGDGSNYIFASAYLDYHPMIRMIVGPSRPITRQNVSVVCENWMYGRVLVYDEEVCGTTLTPAQGGSVTLYMVSQPGNGIAHLFVDGVEIEPFDENTEEGDWSYILSYDSDSAVWVGRYTFENIQADHTIRVVFAEHVTVDPVAANVRLNLQPNPATAQVKLNMEGVEGMVNCKLIDMSGRVVYNQNLNAASAQTVNVSNLAKGAYFVRITNDKFSKVEKLIVR